MAQFFHLVLLATLFISLIVRSSESRILGSIHSTSIAPASTEAFSLIPSPAPSSDGGIKNIWEHHSAGNSFSGGDIILGGFAAALVAALVCYLRITRRSKLGS